MQKDLTEFTFFRGRVALSAILKAMGVGTGDEVAIQAFTCVAVPEAVLSTGAKPVYIDIESGGFNMEPSDLSARITSRTRAVIVQHTYGIPADVAAIKELSDEHGVPLIEDCCHTFSSTVRGRTVGTFGIAGFYSFEWGKPVIVGVGGSAVVNDGALHEAVARLHDDLVFPSEFRTFRIKMQYLASLLLLRPALYWRLKDLYHFLSNLGLAEGNYKPDLDVGDFRLKMPEDRKRLLARKLKVVTARDLHASSIAEQYRSRIVSDGFKHPEYPMDNNVVFVRYPLITDSKKEVLEKARRARIEVADWYTTPVHPLKGNDLLKVLYETGSCAEAERRAGQVVTLPLGGKVTSKYVENVVDFLNRVP